MFSQCTGSFKELGWQEYELGKGRSEHGPRTKAGTGPGPRWSVWLPAGLKCKRQRGEAAEG